MDFYNINWASLQENIYSELKLFYSPVNLVIAKNLVSIECINSRSPSELRSCNSDAVLLSSLFFFVVNIFLISRILSGAENRYLWTFFLALSFPVMYGIERGNYIQICMTFISIFILAKNNVMKNIALSLAILFKPYLLVLSLPYVIFRKCKDFFYVVAAMTIFCILAGFLLGDSEWILIPSNMFSYNHSGRGWYENFYNTTNISLFPLFANNVFNNYYILKLFFITILSIIIYIILRIFIYLKEVELDFNSIIDFNYISFIFIILLLLLSSSPSYYAICLAIPFFSYAVKNNILRLPSKFIFLLILLPYPFKFNFDGINQDSKVLEISFQSILIPILLFSLFLDLTINKQVFMAKDRK